MQAKSRGLAWLIAATATVVAALLAIAIISLLPLKKIVPYTILVDKNTGFVETLKPLDANSLEPDIALTQSFLVQYVIARESFDINSLQTDFRKVRLWTAGDERAKYVSSMQATSAESPLSTYSRSTIVKVFIKSISPLGGNASLVRFDTQSIYSGGSSPPARSWAAVIKHQYNSLPMSQDDRFINPLGFQVISYSKNEEVLPKISLPTNKNISKTNYGGKEQTNGVSDLSSKENSFPDPNLMGAPNNTLNYPKGAPISSPNGARQ